MIVFWIWLFSTTCNTQYTTITGVWNDDYMTTIPGWEYHDGGIIDGTNSSYHGYYLGGGGGISGPSVSLRENYEIERRFYCNAYNSSVDITYIVYYCNCDNSVNDYVELSVNDITKQTTDASSGIFVGSAIDGLSNTCNWYSKSSEIISIQLVILNDLFKIHFKISLNYQGETIVLSNIQIICHPLTPSPTTEIPTTQIPTTNDPTMNPTSYPTINPTFDPTFDPTYDPTSTPTTSEPTHIPTNTPSHLPSNFPSYDSYPPTIYSSTSTVIGDKEVDDQHVTTTDNDEHHDDNKQSLNANKLLLILVVVLIVIGLCIVGVFSFVVIKRRQKNANDTAAMSEHVIATQLQSKSELDHVEMVSTSGGSGYMLNMETLGNNIENNGHGIIRIAQETPNGMSDIEINHDVITNGGDNDNENDINQHDEGTGTESADFEIVGDDEVTMGQQTVQ